MSAAKHRERIRVAETRARIKKWERQDKHQEMLDQHKAHKKKGRKK